jgi:nucleotide-binding universal stress UspA family protein
VTAAPVAAPPLLRNVLVAVDGSPEALEAARQVAMLGPEQASLVSVWMLAPPVVVPRGGVPGYDLEHLRERAERVLEEAAMTLPAARTRAVHGYPWQALLHELRRHEHTLVAVGAHGSSRALGIVAGSVTTELLHKAPCSVLVARPGHSPYRRIVVGVDGSDAAAAALAAAEAIAARSGAEVRAITAHGEPVATLMTAAEDADLLVVGCRGLHGFRSLGSVSERVAHQAPCSTLVVRSNG